MFLAHRKEILTQSIATVRQVIKDQNFGDLWVGDHSPSEHNHILKDGDEFLESWYLDGDKNKKIRAYAIDLYDEENTVNSLKNIIENNLT